MSLIERAAEVRKLLVYVLGVAAEVVAQGLVPEPYAHYVMAAIAVATALGIYGVPNADPPGRHAA